MSSKTHMLEAWCPHWQYRKVAVLFHYYDKVPEESNFGKHLLWLMYNPPFRRKNDGKNGSSCGSRNVKQLVTLSPQSGMNAGTQLTFSFFSFYSICPPHPPPHHSKGWCHPYSEWSSFLSSIYLETSLQIHPKVWLLGHSKSYQVDHKPYPAVKKQPSRSLGQQQCTLDGDSGALVFCSDKELRAAFRPTWLPHPK